MRTTVVSYILGRMKFHPLHQSLTHVGFFFPAFCFHPYRTHKQYFYTNSATGDSQWDYPTEALLTKEQEERWNGNGDGRDSQVMFNRASSQDDSEAQARGSMAMLHGSVTSVQLTAPSKYCHKV